MWFALLLQTWASWKLHKSHDRLDETNNRIMAMMASRIVDLTNDDGERKNMLEFYRSLLKAGLKSRVTPPDDFQPGV